MRKTAIVLSLLGIVALSAAPVLATSLLTETFTYPDGNLVPNGGWTNFSGAVTDIQIAGGRATGTGANANDDHVSFAAQPLTSKTYACFLVKIPAVAGAPKAIYFAGLKDSGTSAFVSRVYVLPITGGFTFGLSHSSTSTTVGVVAWSASTLLYDHDYNIVINYDPVAKASTMWVDPVNESSPSVSIANSTIAALAASTFFLRQTTTASTLPASPSYAGTVDWGFSVDKLGIGTTFTDACLASTIAVESRAWGAVKTLYR